MKNIVKATFLFCSIALLGSCSKNDTNTVPTANGFELRSDATITPPSVLMPSNDADTIAKLVWDRSNNGVAAVAKYTLIVSDHTNDPNFLNATEYNGAGIVVTPELRKCGLKAVEINTLLNKLPTFQCGVMQVDIRVKSTLGTNPKNAFIQYSNPITISVTGYATSLPILTFAKMAAAAATAPKILASTFSSLSDYEGYMYLEPGNYKFYRPDSCGSFANPTVYGGNAGTLVEGTTAADIVITKAGDYLVKANLTPTTLSYTATYLKAFGVFGVAKGTFGSANMVPMVDEGNQNIWRLTINLFNGRKFKFKSNDWTAALTGTPPSVPSGSGTVVISVLGKGILPNSVVEMTTGGDFVVPGTDLSPAVSTSHTIILDISKPRNYTYSIVENL